MHCIVFCSDVHKSHPFAQQRNKERNHLKPDFKNNEKSQLRDAESLDIEPACGCEQSIFTRNNYVDDDERDSVL